MAKDIDIPSHLHEMRYVSETERGEFFYEKT